MTSTIKFVSPRLSFVEVCIVFAAGYLIGSNIQKSRELDEREERLDRIQNKVQPPKLYSEESPTETKPAEPVEKKKNIDIEVTLNDGGIDITFPEKKSSFFGLFKKENK